MRLIDADVLDDVVQRINENGGLITRTEYKTIDRILFEFPTIDAVPVVRCKDCAWCKVCDYDEEKYFICDYDCGLYGDVDPDGFCYRGIERDEID